MKIQYLEIVTPDVDALCETYSSLHDVKFGEGDPALGGARTVKMADGGVLGVRAPLRETEKPIVRHYLLVKDIKAAVDARTDDDFFIMARTDAFAQEGLQKAIDRAQAYIEAGADGIFAEAVQTEQHYRAFSEQLSAPILANITEFGKTELWNKNQLKEWGVDMVLYPLSAFRAMNQAAERVYQSILEHGDQTQVLNTMQTRAELYDYLNYHEFEQKLDDLFSAE